jgi:hypothetical protein
MKPTSCRKLRRRIILSGLQGINNFGNAGDDHCHADDDYARHCRHRARFRLNAIRLYLSFACAIDVKQTAQAPVSEKNRCGRLTCSRWVFPKRFGARQPSGLTTDVCPIDQYADAGCACSRCTYSRSPHYRAPCRSSCHASDAHRSSRSSYPGLSGFNGH